MGRLVYTAVRAPGRPEPACYDGPCLPWTGSGPGPPLPGELLAELLPRVGEINAVPDPDEPR